MSDISLDNSIKIDVIALVGDTFGPIQFMFETGEYICDGDCTDCDQEVTYEIEDLRGAIFEGELYRGKSLVHRFLDSELSFDETTSILTFELNNVLTKQLGNNAYIVLIRQILNDIVTTRISGTIIFSNTPNDV